MTPAHDYATPQVDSVWRHYKGGLYTVIGIAIDAEGDEKKKLVLYRIKNDPTAQVWSRPLADWYAMISRVPCLVPRFVPVDG